MADTSDAGLAVALAARAGELLVSLRAEAAAAGRTGNEAGAEGDSRSNDLILAGIAEARPGDLVLSEESADDPRRLGADRVWIVDPLDGTREYGLGGRADWAVHVALWDRHGDPARARITAAAVGLPAERLVLGSARPPALAAFVGGRPARVVHSESRPPRWLPTLGEVFPMVARPLGSAGAKAMAVVRGAADAYVHAGGQHEWDSAAPAGVALAAGLHASRLDGSPLVYNQAEPWLPDLVICRQELADDLLAALARALEGTR